MERSAIRGELDTATPSYQSRPSKPSRPLPVVVDRQHLAADRLGRVGGEEHRERRDVRWLDHRLDRLRGHRLGAHLLDRPAADLRAYNRYRDDSARVIPTTF